MAGQQPLYAPTRETLDASQALPETADERLGANQIKRSLVGQPYDAQAAILAPDQAAGELAPGAGEPSFESQEAARVPPESAAGAGPVAGASKGVPLGMVKAYTALGTAAGTAEPGSCEVESSNIASRAHASSGGALKPDRVYNGVHKVVRFGDQYLDTSAAQFVALPEGVQPPVLTGTLPEVKQQLIELATKYGIRADNAPSGVTTPGALADAVYDDAKVIDHGEALTIKKSGKGAYYDSAKNAQIEAEQAAAGAAPKPDAAAAATTPTAHSAPATPATPAAAPSTEGDGSIDVDIYADDEHDAPSAGAAKRAPTSPENSPRASAAGSSPERLREAATPPDVTKRSLGRAPAIPDEGLELMPRVVDPDAGIKAASVPPVVTTPGPTDVRTSGRVVGDASIGVYTEEAQGVERDRTGAPKADIKTKEAGSQRNTTMVGLDTEKGMATASHKREAAVVGADGVTAGESAAANIGVGTGGLEAGAAVGKSATAADGKKRESETRLGAALSDDSARLSAGHDATFSKGDDDKTKIGGSGFVDLTKREAGAAFSVAREKPDANRSDYATEPGGKKWSAGASGAVGLTEGGALGKLEGGVSGSYGNVSANASAGMEYAPSAPQPGPDGTWIVSWTEGTKAGMGGGYGPASAGVNQADKQSRSKSFASRAEADAFYRGLQAGKPPTESYARAAAHLKEGESVASSSETSANAGLKGDLGVVKLGAGLTLGTTHQEGAVAKAGGKIEVTVYDDNAIGGNASMGGAGIGGSLNASSHKGSGKVVEFDTSTPVGKQAYDRYLALGHLPTELEGTGYRVLKRNEGSGESSGIGASVPFVTGSKQRSSEDLKSTDDKGNVTETSSANVTEKLQGTKLPFGLGRIGPDTSDTIDYQASAVNGKGQGAKADNAIHSSDVDDTARRVAASTGTAATAPQLRNENEQPLDVQTHDRWSQAQIDMALAKIMSGDVNMTEGAKGATVNMVGPIRQLQARLAAAGNDEKARRQALRDLVEHEDKDALFLLRSLTHSEQVVTVTGETCFFGADGYARIEQQLGEYEDDIAKGEFESPLDIRAQNLRRNLTDAIRDLRDPLKLTQIPPAVKETEANRVGAFLARLDAVTAKASDKRAGAGPAESDQVAAARADILDMLPKLDVARKHAEAAQRKARRHAAIHAGYGSGAGGGRTARDKLDEDDAYGLAGMNTLMADLWWETSLKSDAKVPAAATVSSYVPQGEEYENREELAMKWMTGWQTIVTTATFWYGQTESKYNEVSGIYQGIVDRHPDEANNDTSGVLAGYSLPDPPGLSNQGGKNATSAPSGSMSGDELRRRHAQQVAQAAAQQQAAADAAKNAELEQQVKAAEGPMESAHQAALAQHNLLSMRVSANKTPENVRIFDTAWRPWWGCETDRKAYPGMANVAPDKRLAFLQSLAAKYQAAKTGFDDALRQVPGG